MFDAGAVEAELRVRLDRFDRDLDTAEARVRKFTSQPHVVRVRPEVDGAGEARVRRQVADLDQRLAGDARQRARSGTGLLGSLFGGIGPGILGLSGKLTAGVGIGGSLLGALPAAGALGAGVGVLGLGAGVLLKSSKDLQDQAKKMLSGLEHTFTQAAQPLVRPLEQAFAQIPRFFAGIEPELHKLFAAAGPLLIPLIRGLESLVRGLLPGLVSLLRAAGPAFRVFAQILGMLGRDLGSMFRDFAPVIKASAAILKALAGVLGGILPVVGKLAAVFASALAPAFSTFAGLIREMEPVLTLVGRVLASLARAVLGDLIGAFTALVSLIRGITPSLGVLARVLSQVFGILENSGVFAVIGNALEQLSRPLAALINALVRSLVPVLPVVIRLMSGLASGAVVVLARVLGDLIRPLTWLISKMPALVPVILGVVVAVKAWRAAQALLDLVLEANPIGLIITAIGALVVAIVELVTHWRTVWTAVRNVAEDAWDFLTHGWGQFILPGLTGIRLAVAFLRDHWQQIWGDIKQIALDFGRWLWTDFAAKIVNFFDTTLPSAFHAAVSAIGRVWNTIKGIVTAPVRFIIDDVIDGLIRVFDWISSKVGGPHIAEVHPFGLAQGGRIYGGSAEGADDVLARVGKNETVLSAPHSRMLAPILAAAGVPGYAKGGIPSKQRAVGHAASPDTGPLGKIGDIGKIIAAITTGNTKALVNAFSDLTGARKPSGAVGAMAQLLTAVPKALISQAVKFLVGNFGFSGSAPEIIRYAASFIGKVPYVWGGDTPAGWDCSGFVKWVMNHFGYSPPRTSQEQFGWVKRTPTAVPGGLAFFAGADGTQASPGHVGLVIDQFKMIDAFGTGFGTRVDKIYGSSGAISGYGVPPGGFHHKGGGPVPVGGNVVSWLRQAMALTGRPGSWLRGLEEIQHAETDDLPNKTTVVNPNGGATGLMQVKPATYAAFASSPGGILNPVSNAVAAIRYIMSQYGNPYRIPGLGTSSYRGYDTGGWLDPGLTLAFNNSGQREAVLTRGESSAYKTLARAAEIMMSGPPSRGGTKVADTVNIQLPEGSTVAEALRELDFRMRVARQQGFAGVIP